MSDPNPPSKKPGAPDLRQEPKARKQISLLSVPNDRDMTAEAMEELFDEDRVTHQHGSSEPDAD